MLYKKWYNVLKREGYMEINIKELLLSKNGKVVTELARIFLEIENGDRIYTVTELCDMFQEPRGTIQNAIKTLQTSNAVQIESKGIKGSYLVSKNVRLLLSIAGIESLVGTMPLPYSKRYEGLATGLISALENSYSIPSMMSYVRGAKNRIGLVLEGRYDFAIVSKYAAEEFMKKDDRVTIIKEFGKETYCSAHAIIFHDKNATSIKDGMRIGIDADSVDQSNLTKAVCKGYNVNFYPVSYNTLLEKVVEGTLDATVWNIDEVIGQTKKINYIKISEENQDDTNAVIVTSKSRKEVCSLLMKLIDVEQVLKIQKLVMEGKITPNY